MDISETVEVKGHEKCIFETPHDALCVSPHYKVSIGQYTKMCTLLLIFFQFHYFKWKIFEENIWSNFLAPFINAFLVNKRSLFHSKMPIIWTLNRSLGCIYIVYYIVYVVFLVLNWLSNLEFQLPKKEDQVARIGVMGGV